MRPLSLLESMPIWGLAVLLLGSWQPVMGQQLDPTAALRWQQEYQELYQHLRPSVVAVRGSRAPRADGSFMFYYRGQYYGTGFLVHPGLVVTAAEIVSSEQQVQCVFYDYQKIMGQVIACDTNRRLALIKVPRTDLPTLPITTEFCIGQPVVTVANVFGSISRVYQAAFSAGIISGVYRPSQGKFHRRAIETDAAVNPGSFGGPLVDFQGRVVGVLTPAYSRLRWLGMAIPGRVLLDFLADVESGKILPPPARPVYPEARDVYLGLTVECKRRNYVIVTAVEPESPAADGGLQVGDHLVYVGKFAIRNQDSLAKALKYYQPGARIAVLVLRAKAKIWTVVILRSRFF